MRRFSRNAIRAGWAVVVICLLLTGTAFARDRGHDLDHRGGWSGHREHDRDRDRGRDRDWRRDRHERGWARHRQDQDEDWRRHERSHDRDDLRAARYDRRPPGWDRGRKEGWRNGNVPPGLAK